MANVINANLQYPDIFLGASEQSGSFKNDRNEEVKYHNFLVDIACSDRTTNSNTVSSCGYEGLGFVKGSDGKFSDKRKIKFEDTPNVFGCQVSSAAWFNNKVFKNCLVVWDKSGNIKRIVFEPDEPKK